MSMQISAGNGRMARLWHTAILAKWNPIFEYIPIESQIEKFQDDYYDAIAKCHVESFEWQQLASENPVIYTRTGEIQQEMMDIDGDPNRYNRGGEIVEERIEVPDYGCRLPDSIAGFTTETVYNDENTHLSFKQGGGHGGSHPHMIHEFVRAIIEDRKPVVDDIVGAYWTGTGICAHQSAMEGGTVVKVPEFKKYL